MPLDSGNTDAVERNSQALEVERLFEQPRGDTSRWLEHRAAINRSEFTGQKQAYGRRAGIDTPSSSRCQSLAAREREAASEEALLARARELC